MVAEIAGISLCRSLARLHALEIGALGSNCGGDLLRRFRLRLDIADRRRIGPVNWRRGNWDRAIKKALLRQRRRIWRRERGC